MSRKRVSKTELHKFTQRAGDSITTLQTDFGTWAAVVWVDGKLYEVETEALNPESDGYIREITREEADKLIVTDFRAVTRY